jgi:hypothetical protein
MYITQKRGKIFIKLEKKSRRKSAQRIPKNIKTPKSINHMCPRQCHVLIQVIFVPYPKPFFW